LLSKRKDVSSVVASDIVTRLWPLEWGKSQVLVYVFRLVEIQPPRINAVIYQVTVLVVPPVAGGFIKEVDDPSISRIDCTISRNTSVAVPLICGIGIV
jgi:hypothetical protein